MSEFKLPWRIDFGDKNLCTEIQTCYWTDSTTALSWIKKNDQWSILAGNRVKEICSLTVSSQWLHMLGQLNPADLPSRECIPHEIINSLWWEGSHKKPER